MKKQNVETKTGNVIRETSLKKRVYYYLKRKKNKRKEMFTHKSVRTLWRDVQVNFRIPVLNFSISSIMLCGIHELSDVAPPSREMLFCGAVNVVGKVLWNEMFYIITVVFLCFADQGWRGRRDGNRSQAVTAFLQNLDQLRSWDRFALPFPVIGRF